MNNHPFLKRLDMIEAKLDTLINLLKQKPDIISKKDIINNKECMELFKISTGTLSNWRKSGKIPYKQIDNKFFYLPKEIIKTFKK